MEPYYVMKHPSVTILLIAVCFAGPVLTVELYSYGSSVGDNSLPRQNDIYQEIPLTNGVPFFDKLYNKAFINDNGLISMVVQVADANVKEPLPINGGPESDNPRVLIAPFWANVDVTEGGTVFYRQVSEKDDDAMERATEEIRKCFVTEFDFTAKHGVVVTWDDVSFFGHDSETEDPRNTFQLVLASDGFETFAFFLYDTIVWNAGTESLGDPKFGTGDRGASIGFNSGDVYKHFTHSRSSGNAASQTIIDQQENCVTLGEGAYIYKIDGVDIVESGCKNDADLTIFPAVGSMFGGEEIFLVGPCWDSQADVKCRFLYNNELVQEVQGTVISAEGAACVPEPFFFSGELKLEVSVDAGVSYTLAQVYTVVNLDRMSSTGVSRVNPTWENWDAAGFPLEVTWDSDKFDPAANISITVLAYLEDGSAGPRWEEVYHIEEVTMNDGSQDFEGVATSGISEYNAFGAIRIHDQNKPNGLKLWSGVHTFGYLLNQEYQDDPKSWSRTMCDRWAQDEDELEDFVDNLIPCPCTLQQAIVDTGRFQPDTGCSMYAGSVCTYHQGAEHCVRSVAASDFTNSGTQCCYGDDGHLMYAGDTDQGSTADRSHVWGAEPYQAIDMVPGLSHWKHDVITFYYCCLWGDDCKTYLMLRPTADCKEYNPPRASTTFGDPHFVTFDDLTYSFNGKGEWTMVEIPSYEFELQGRTEQARCQSCGAINDTEGEPQQATALTAVAMTEMDADTIHVELNSITTLKFVRRFSGVSEIVAFNGLNWLDFNGVSIVVIESNGNNIEKATITFWNSGTGINVTANGQMLAVTVTLPPSLKDNVADVRGLLGNWDNSSTNDLIERNGNQLDPETATPYDIMDFGLTWELENTLFFYESGRQHSDYQDNDFVPLYVAPDLSTLPVDLQQDIERICGDVEACIYDMSLTRSTEVGDYTIEAMDYIMLTNMYTEPLVACPFIPTPRNGTKMYQTDQENNLEGAHIVFACDEGLTLTGPEERICQENGQWTGEGDNDCIATGCSPLTSPKNGYIDIIYEDGNFIAVTVCEVGYSLEGSGRRTCNNGKWSGKSATCIGGLSGGAKAGIIIGVLLSIVLVLAIVAAAIMFNKHKTGEAKLDKGTHVKEVGGGENWGMEAEVADATAANVDAGKHETSVVDT